jgi:hypothetical protein
MTDEHKEILHRSENLLKEKLSLKNYRERFKLLISCEEHQMKIDIRNFDMKVTIWLFNLEITFDLKRFYFEVK